MIPQVSNAVSVSSTALQPPASAALRGAEARPQSVADIELPQQAVKGMTSAESFDRVKQATEQINQVVQKLGRDLQFSVDPDTHTQVVKVVDTQTKEVIRQMPTQEMLAIAKALDKLQGLLLKDKV